MYVYTYIYIYTYACVHLHIHTHIHMCEDAARARRHRGGTSGPRLSTMIAAGISDMLIKLHSLAISISIRIQVYIIAV